VLPGRVSDRVAEAYDKHLFKGATLQDLPDGLRFVINATNVQSGALWRFMKPYMRDYRVGEVVTPKIPLAQAVAASSAFPPVLSPFEMRLNPDSFTPNSGHDLQRKPFTTHVFLTDGGVYDNLGVNPLLRHQRNPLDFCIVSDGGKPFTINEQPTNSGAIVLKASLDIMMEQIRGLEFDRLQHRFLAKDGPKPLWFSIDSKEGEAQAGDAAFSSAIATNLQRLSDDEMNVLTRHGGALVEARVRRYAPELVSA